MNQENDNKKRTRTAAQALHALMNICARSEKSSHDALRLMRGWGVEPCQAAGVLEKLKAEKFIDDTRYAGAYVREKSAVNGWGPRKIEAMLRMKGIPSGIIKTALDQVSEQCGRQTLSRKLENKIKTVSPDADPWKLKARLIRYGNSAGFDYGDVIAETERLLKEYGFKN